MEFFMTNLLISLFIKDKENVKDAKVRNAYGKMAGIVGICCNIFLFATKFFAGIITGAISITADAFNNLSDAASSIITLVGFGMAGKPADEDHPFGHGRMEYVSGLVVSILILMMGVELFKTSVEKVNHPSLPTHPDHELYNKYFPNGAGSIFTFEIKGGQEAAWKFIDSLEIFSLLANVADVKSLVIHPYTTTHSQMSPEELAQQHITPSTVRLSIGTEYIDDIIDDLDQAFVKI